MKIAFETVIWGRELDDTELVLDAIAACGYQGVEFAQSPDQIFVRDTAAPTGRRAVRDISELLTLLGARGLNLVGMAGGTLTARMEFCGDYRPEYLYVENWREDDEEAGRALNAHPPFTLALHPLWFKKVQRLSQARKLLHGYQERFPEGHHLRLLPDTAHMTIVGEEPTTAIADVLGEVAAVHLKDWIPTYGRYSHRYAQGFVPLGRGVVPLGAVLETLKQHQYSGWVVVSMDSASNSGFEIAAACASWLTARGCMKQREMTTPAVEHILQREGTNRNTQPITADAAREMQFIDYTLKATDLGPARFYQAAVEALHRLGGLDAARLYSYNPHNEQLYLLAASDPPQQACRTILEADTGLWRLAINEQRTRHFDLSNPVNAMQFDEPDALAALPAKQLITVPIFNHSNPHQLRYLLNLFPSASDYWGAGPTGTGELNRLAVHFSRLAENVIGDACSAAAMETSYTCGLSTTKKEFLARLVSQMHRYFNCEGVSIFLVNETGDRLELMETATSGVVWAPNLKPHERHYRKGEGLTGRVWSAGEMLLLSDAGVQPDVRERSWEHGLSPGREECLFFPMSKLGGTVLGVIRLVNKRPVTGSRQASMFTDDDAAILDSIVQAALPYLELLTLQERQLSALTRMTHEFQMPMVAIRAAVDFMQHKLKDQNQTARDVFGEDYLDDVLNWSGLMGRLVSNARVFASAPGSILLRPSRTLLMRDVVAPAVHQVRSLLHDRGFDPKAIQFGDFTDVPALWIDRHQFQQIIFNLLSNAIKYAEGTTLKVRIDAVRSGNAFLMSFHDWGFGIEDGSEDLIFQPGYRSREAMRRDTSGQGIGLSVVRTIVEAHSGRIRLKSNRLPTTFEISLPESLRLKPPGGQNQIQ